MTTHKGLSAGLDLLTFLIGASGGERVIRPSREVLDTSVLITYSSNSVDSMVVGGASRVGSEPLTEQGPH